MKKTDPNIALPSYNERLPKLLELIKETARRMKNLPDIATYLPNWEPLYDYVHSFKGLTKIIGCTEKEKDNIFAIAGTLGEIAVGPYAVRNGPKVAEVLLQLHDLLRDDQEIESCLKELISRCEKEFDHTERLKRIPMPVDNLSDYSSKRAYEVERFQLSNRIYQELIDLENFPQWHHKLENSVRGEDKDRRGLLIACLPFFEPGTDNKRVKAWAWVAPGRPDDESVFQRVAAALPNAKTEAT